VIVALLPTQGLVEAVGPVDGVELVVWRGDGPPPRDRADLVVPDYARGRAALARLDAVAGLRVVQVQTAGYDGVSSWCPTASCSPAPAASTTTRPRSWRSG
jgi:hypothetical protein